MREYIVPVVFRSVSELVVKAETQAEAINIVREKIKNNPHANSIYDNYKILETEIDCLQDDEILDEVKKMSSEEMSFKEFLDEFSTSTGKENFTKTYRSVSGSDMIWIIDGKIVEELWTMHLNGNKKEISFDIILFNKIVELNKLFSSLKDSKIIQVIINEDGSKIYRTFTDVNFLYKSSTQSIDDPSLTEKYTLSYKSEIPFSTFDCSIQELIKHA